MGIAISGNSIRLVDNQNILDAIDGILRESNISVYDGEGPLSSTKALAKKIEQEGNLSFLRREILSYINEHGYPCVTFLESGRGIDDSYRALKNFLLSWIIIMQGEQYKNIFCNMVILLDAAGYKKFNETYKKPHSILGMVKTGDERINNIINQYMTDSERFRKNFNILVTNSGQELSLVRSEIVLFINMIRSREKLLGKLASEKKPNSTGPKTDAAEAADVTVRVGNNIYKNGDRVDRYNSSEYIPEKEIFITGNFTSYTRLQVNERLLKLIRTGCGDDFSFRKSDPIIINIPGESIIDSTVPVTLTQLMSQELKEYRNTRIKIPSRHYKTMQESKGFSLIQRNLIIHEF